jgi:type I restriction enzyme, S subunit
LSLETFFNNFAVLADAPNGIAKLRELILQLAVRGKLVPQNPSEVPASVLLEKIAQEKASRSNGTKIGSTKENSVEQTAALYSLPPGWLWARFGDVTINRDGERIPVEKSVRHGRHGIYDYYGASGVIDKIDDYLFDRPLLLIGEDGANLINRSTPIAFIAKGKYWVNNHAHVLDSLSLECLQYLEIFVNAIDLRPYITGTAQPKMNQAKMNSILVALAPEAEQKRIVSKVTELMRLCDELEPQQQAKRKSRVRLNRAILAPLNKAASLTPDEFDQATTRLADNFDTLYDSIDTVSKLRSTILQLAVQGKLVPQDRNDEPSSELLNRINSEKNRLMAKKAINKPLLNPRGSEIRFKLPESWQWVRLNDVFDVRDGTHDTPKYVANGFPLVTSKNLYTGVLDLSQVKYISESDHLKIAARSRVEKDDILFAMIGSIGNPIIVETETEFSIKNVALFKYYSRELSEPKFLHLFLRSAAEHIREESAGGVQSFISLGFLRKYPMPLPPLAEQKRIVAKVNQLMSLCDELEAKLRQAEADSEKLMNAAVKFVLDSVRDVSKTAEEVFA